MPGSNNEFKANILIKFNTKQNTFSQQQVIPKKGRKIKMYSNLLRVIITGINLFKQRRITVFNDTILCEQILFQKRNEKQKVSSSLLTRAYLGFVFKFCSTPGNLCKTNRVYRNFHFFLFLEFVRQVCLLIDAAARVNCDLKDRS